MRSPRHTFSRELSLRAHGVGLSIGLRLDDNHRLLMAASALQPEPCVCVGLRARSRALVSTAWLGPPRLWSPAARNGHIEGARDVGDLVHRLGQSGGEQRGANE